MWALLLGGGTFWLSLLLLPSVLIAGDVPHSPLQGPPAQQSPLDRQGGTSPAPGVSIRDPLREGQPTGRTENCVLLHAS